MEFQRLTSTFDYDTRKLEQGIRRATELNRTYQRNIAGGFRDAEREAGKSFQNITRQGEQAFATLEKTARGHASGISRALSSVRFGGRGGGGGSDDDGGLFKSLGKVIELIPGLNILKGGITGVASAMVDGVRFGFDYRKMIEENTLTLTKYFGTAEKARKFIGELATMRTEGLGLEDALTGANRLLALGYAAKEIPSIMLAVADASRQTGADVDGITNALLQMTSKGVASMEELRGQLGERAVPVFKYLTDEIARTDKAFAKLSEPRRLQEFGKMVERGEISGRGAAEVILRGFQREHGGAGRAWASQTASGLEFQNMEALRERAGQALGPAFEQGYKTVLGGTLQALESEWAKSAAQRAADLSAPLFKTFTIQLNQLGLGAGASFSEGVRGAQGDIYKAGSEAGGQLEQGVRDRLQQNSPSRVMLALGFEAGQSLAEGFRQGTKGRVIGDEIEKIVQEAAARYGLDPNLIKAVMRRESSNKPGAVSPKGASGLMQLMPGTAERYGVKNIFDPRQNIMGGAHYLADLLKMFGGDVRLAVAGYNAGEGAVKKYGNRIPPYKETQAYVPAVLGEYRRLSGGDAVPVTIVGGLNFQTGAGESLMSQADAEAAAQAGKLLRTALEEFAQGQSNFQTAIDERRSQVAGLKSKRLFTEGERQSRDLAVRTLQGEIGLLENDLAIYLRSKTRIIEDYRAQLAAAVNAPPANPDLLPREEFIKRNVYSPQMKGVVSAAMSAADWEGYDRTHPGISHLWDTDKAIEQVTVDAVKLTQVFDQSLIPFPGAADGVRNIADEMRRLNGEIPQTTPLRAAKPKDFYGLTPASLAGAFRSNFVGSFTDFSQSPGGMFRSFGLGLAQSIGGQIIGHIGDEFSKRIEDRLNNLFGEQKTATQQAAQQVTTAVNIQGGMTVSAIHELQHNLLAASAGPGLGAQLLGTFLGSVGSQIGAGLVRDIFGDDDGRESGGTSRPTSPPVLKRARGGDVPAFTPFIGGEAGYEALILDRPGHVLNHAQTEQFLRPTWNSNTNNVNNNQRGGNTYHITVNVPQNPGGAGYNHGRMSEHQFGRMVADLVRRTIERDGG